MISKLILLQPTAILWKQAQRIAFHLRRIFVFAYTFNSIYNLKKSNLDCMEIDGKD